MGKWTEANYETEFISKVRSIFDAINDKKEGDKLVTFEEFVDKLDVNNKSTKVFFEEMIKETCGVPHGSSTSSTSASAPYQYRRYRDYTYGNRDWPRNLYFVPGNQTSIFDSNPNPYHQINISTANNSSSANPNSSNPNPNTSTSNTNNALPNNNPNNSSNGTPNGNPAGASGINHHQQFDQLNQQSQQVLQHVRSQMASSLSSSLNTNLPYQAYPSLLLSGANTSSSSSSTTNNPLLPIPMMPFNSSSSSSSSSPSNSTSTPVSPSLQSANHTFEYNPLLSSHLPSPSPPPRVNIFRYMPIRSNINLSNSSLINSPPSSPPTSNHSSTFISSPSHNNL